MQPAAVGIPSPPPTSSPKQWNSPASANYELTMILKQVRRTRHYTHRMPATNPKRACRPKRTLSALTAKRRVISPAIVAVLGEPKRVNTPPRDVHHERTIV